MDLQQSRHGCAEIKRGPERTREDVWVIPASGRLVNGLYDAQFFLIVVSGIEVDPVATGAPAAGGCSAAAKLGGGLAAT